MGIEMPSVARKNEYSGLKVGLENRHGIYDARVQGMYNVTTEAYSNWREHEDRKSWEYEGGGGIKVKREVKLNANRTGGFVE